MVGCDDENEETLADLFCRFSGAAPSLEGLSSDPGKAGYLSAEKRAGEQALSVGARGELGAVQKNASAGEFRQLSAAYCASAPARGHRNS
jgi:hypothetical protein